MLYLSKSGYCELWQCPKMLWMRKFKPEEAEVNDNVQSILETGNKVGDLAMDLFGDYVEVTAFKDEKIDLSKMIEQTYAEIEKGTEVICEASFQFGGLYCAVDILKKENDGYAIYEVKSSTDPYKQVYIADVSYQKYVLENCGINVTGTYIVTINSDYIFDGNLDLHKFFNITDVSEELATEEKNIKANLSIAERILKAGVEPDIDLHKGCNKPYKCAFWGYCTKDLPKPNVFDLYRMNFDKKLEYYHKGIIKYDDLLYNEGIKNPKQLRQIEYYLNNSADYIDKDGIRDFLDTLTYPLYFLDFETMQLAIPEFVGTKPYAQIPFQYSLHYIECEGGELKHKEFLAESGTNPLRAIAESLCRDIPKNVCVTAYNKAFECARLKELAIYFPDLAEHLLNIKENIKDLLIPFQSGYYYNKAMGGSFSIKGVLPALFPNDPSLDYNNLEGVHNGSEAMTVFPKIKDMPAAEQKITRHNLLKYCELDTYAMVKIWEKLSDVIK